MHYCIYTEVVVKNKPDLINNMEISPDKSSHRKKSKCMCLYVQITINKKIMENNLSDTFQWAREGN